MRSSIRSKKFCTTGRETRTVNEATVVPNLFDELDEDYESLAEAADEWGDKESGTKAASRTRRDAIAQEIE